MCALQGDGVQLTAVRAIRGLASGAKWRGDCRPDLIATSTCECDGGSF